MLRKATNVWAQTMTEISVQQRVIGKVTSIFLLPWQRCGRLSLVPRNIFNPPGVLQLVTAQSNAKGNQKWRSEYVYLYIQWASKNTLKDWFFNASTFRLKYFRQEEGLKRMRCALPAEKLPKITTIWIYWNSCVLHIPKLKGYYI